MLFAKLETEHPFQLHHVAVAQLFCGWHIGWIGGELALSASLKPFGEDSWMASSKRC